MSSFMTRAQPMTVDSAFLYNLDIKFEGSNVHIDGNYQYILDNFVEYFLEHPEIAIHIRGHVCCRPGQRISRLRARNVYRFLKQHGIDKSRMTYAGYSDTMPVASPERTEEDERVNRRVDFILTKK
jgi:outer membrane protein OmpA-like peptidoglycan-associated protein